MSVRRGAPANSSVIYIGQIPYEWDEPTVKSVVCGSGNVIDVRLGFDYVGKNKGFCFVEYLTPQEAHRAMQLIGMIQIMTAKQVKKLRVESSKEGFKTGNPSDQKPILPLDRSRLPPNVQLPQEMLMNGPPPPQVPNPALPVPNYPTNIPLPGQMPMKLANASKQLPQPQNIPLEVSDKINETLSQVPPAILIELISQLKNMLAGPDSARAYEVFQVSPHLATASAQALLLMGFVDADVIQESMKAANPPPPPPPPAQYQNYQNNYQPQFNQASKWPHLPPNTQQKLMAMQPDQAELIAQVLSLPSDQISSLPHDKQAMVSSLRAQYL